MTDAKGGITPGFQHLIELDQRLATTVRQRLANAKRAADGGADAAWSSRRWDLIAYEARKAYEIACQGWACAHLRESGDG